MIVYFDKDNLLSAVSPAMGAVSNKNTIASIEGILLDCRYNNSDESSDDFDICYLLAYDMEKGMKTAAPVRIEEQGSCIINAQKLFQFIKLLPDGEIKISVDEKLRCKIEGGHSSSFEVRVLPGEDFPNLPELRGDKGFSVPQNVIKSFINKTSFAVAVNDQRVALNGFYFKFKDSSITIVTCDSGRIAMCSKECDLENKSIEEKPLDGLCIIPGKSMTEISKLIKDTDEKLEVYLARKHIIFKIGAITYFSRLIEAEYVNYERFIAEDESNIVYVNSKELRLCLERAAVIAEERIAGSVRSFVKISVDGQIMKISSNSSNGAANDEIMIEHTGENVEMAFNCRFLLDAIRAAADVDELKISFVSPPRTGIIIVPSDKKESESDSDNFMFVVMPVKNV